MYNNQKNLAWDAQDLHSNWLKIVHVANVTNTVMDAISNIDMNVAFNVNEDILNDKDENDYIHGEHMHLMRVLSQPFQENTDFDTSVGECFANISEAVEDIALLSWLKLLISKGLEPPYNTSTMVVVNITVWG